MFEKHFYNYPAWKALDSESLHFLNEKSILSCKVKSELIGKSIYIFF